MSCTAAIMRPHAALLPPGQRAPRPASRGVGAGATLLLAVLIIGALAAMTRAPPQPAAVVLGEKPGKGIIFNTVSEEVLPIPLAPLCSLPPSRSRSPCAASLPRPGVATASCSSLSRRLLQLLSSALVPPFAAGASVGTAWSRGLTPTPARQSPASLLRGGSTVNRFTVDRGSNVRVIYIRHGQSEWNIRKDLYAEAKAEAEAVGKEVDAKKPKNEHPDATLTAKGVRDAHEAGLRIAHAWPGINEKNTVVRRRGARARNPCALAANTNCPRACAARTADRCRVFAATLFESGPCRVRLPARQPISGAVCAHPLPL